MNLELCIVESQASVLLENEGRKFLSLDAIVNLQISHIEIATASSFTSQIVQLQFTKRKREES